jgi:hypothetical protein
LEDHLKRLVVQQDYLNKGSVEEEEEEDLEDLEEVDHQMLMEDQKVVAEDEVEEEVKAKQM